MFWGQVYNTRVTDCGVHDFVLDGTAKNGEGIYVGEKRRAFALKGQRLMFMRRYVAAPIVAFVEMALFATVVLGMLSLWCSSYRVVPARL